MALPSEEIAKLQRKIDLDVRNLGFVLSVAFLLILPFAWHAYGWLWSFAGGLF